MKPAYRVIHDILHNPAYGSMSINLVNYPVKVHTNGCRYIDYDNIRFIQQNPDKKNSLGKLTKYAEMARKGYKITWGMRPGDWINITDPPDK